MPASTFLSCSQNVLRCRKTVSDDFLAGCSASVAVMKTDATATTTASSSVFVACAREDISPYTCFRNIAKSRRRSPSFSYQRPQIVSVGGIDHHEIGFLPASRRSKTAERNSCKEFPGSAAWRRAGTRVSSRPAPLNPRRIVAGTRAKSGVRCAGISWNGILKIPFVS